MRRILNGEDHIEIPCWHYSSGRGKELEALKATSNETLIIPIACRAMPRCLGTR